MGVAAGLEATINSLVAKLASGSMVRLDSHKAAILLADSRITSNRPIESKLFHSAEEPMGRDIQFHPEEHGQSSLAVRITCY